MRQLYSVSLCIFLIGIFVSINHSLAADPHRMVVEPAAGDAPAKEDSIGSACNIRKLDTKNGVCREDADCVGDYLGVSPSSCKTGLCCFPNTGSASDPSWDFGSAADSTTDDKSSGSPSCSDGTKKGTCSTTCPVADRITATCSGGDFCCTSSGASGTGSASGSTGTGAGAGASSGGGMVNIIIKNPVAYPTVEAFLSGGILKWLRGIIVTIALVFFVIGAILYILGGADEGNIKKGKAAMTAAALGLVLALAAPTFLQEIYKLFGGPSVSLGPTVVQVALNILKFLLSLVGIVTLIMLVVSGLAYMASAGDESRAKTAKSMATGAVIGLTLAMAALIIVRQIAKFFL